jgi:RimJ/RimL family protein N-acetyltransferase
MSTIDETQLFEYLQKPFILITRRLIIVPTPLTIQYNAYVHLYGNLLSDEAFCQMAFGPHLLAREMSDEDARNIIFTRDLERCWKRRGLGDFSVGLRNRSDGSGMIPDDSGRRIGGSETLEIVELVDSEGSNTSIGGFGSHILNNVEWVGYAGVRDATTTSMPDRTADDEPLPPWQEMVELRYGVHSDYWGKGVAGEAARAVMQWSVSERGVKRFIAETEKTNVRSGQVLKKMGFRESGTNYWKEPSETEWEKVVM